MRQCVHISVSVQVLDEAPEFSSYMKFCCESVKFSAQWSKPKNQIKQMDSTKKKIEQDQTGQRTTTTIQIYNIMD